MIKDNKPVDYIAHWGIKGMKWGIRKEEKSDMVPQQRQEQKDNTNTQELTEKSRNKKLKQAGIAIAGISAAILVIAGKHFKKKNTNSNIAPGYGIVPIYHSGIKGMKWGVRRYQNEDGVLTPEGRERYGVTSDRDERKLRKQAAKLDKQM